MLSSSLFESVFNSSPAGNVLLSPTREAIILAVNDVLLENVARTREELVGVSVFDAFPESPDDTGDTGVTALRASLLRVIETGQPDALPMQRYPIEITNSDGKRRYEERFWSAVNTPVFGRDGKLLCISHRTMDVTEQARAEAALRRTEARYRSLFESIDQGFCIIEMLFEDEGNSVDYRFLEVNPMFASQTGLSDVIGKTMRELAPRHEQHWFDIYAKVARTGEPVRFENEARELKRWYDVYAFSIDDPELHRVAILFKDITHKRRADELLRSSERQALEAARQAEAERRRLDAVLEAVPVGIVVSDASGVILHANHAFKRFWGVRHPQSHGADIPSQWKGWWADRSERHGRRLEPDEWTMVRILRGEEALDDIIEIESFDMPPVRRIVLNSGAPIKDAKGATIGAVVAKLDITDRIKTEEALRQADRRKDEFLAMLAHELRNPLAPIAAAADLLGTACLNEQKVKQTSAIISRQVRHMTGLIDDLLDVSRVTRGLVKLRKTRLDAKQIVLDAVEQVRPLIAARRHTLTVQSPPDTLYVSGDQKRLVQVMTNLLNNAAKYTPEGGDISLTVEHRDDVVCMVVADNGIGMAPELVERAFELFAQAERPSDRSQGGLGIGLALVRSLMERHGGTISAYSDGVGKGSRFTVCLPLLRETAGQSDTARRTETTAATTRALKVMVVDDNKDAAQTLALYVEAMGHQVFVEHSARKALEKARVEKPDVGLLDIGLPDMDGSELARQLRAHAETADSILVAVTGYGQEQDRNKALQSGFDHHFVKPVDGAKLARLLGDIGKM